jgi:hypothetical protein
MRASLAFAALALALAGCGSNGPAAGGGAQDEEEPKLALVNVAELRGTDYLVADVTDGTSYDSLSLSKSSGPAVRNILLIRRADGSSRPLLPDNRLHIDQAYFAPALAGAPLETYRSYSGSDSGVGDRRIDDEDAAPVYFVLETVTGEDRPISIRVGTIADLKSAVVLTGLTEVVARWMIDDHRLALIGRRGAKTEYFEIDINAKKQLASHAIEIGKLEGE